MISEAAVILVAAALYLFDCLVLLERGQAVLQAGLTGLRLSFGSPHYQFRGKVVALLNPLTPFVSCLRTRRLLHGGAPAKIMPSAAFKALAPLSILSAAQFALVFGALSFCLVRAPGWPFFIALVLAYVNAAAMLLLVFLRLGSAGIPRSPLFGLGFGWLACLPLSVNCGRATGLSFPLAVDATRAMRFLSPRQRPAAAQALGVQIEEAMLEVEEGDVDHAKLADLKQQLRVSQGSERA